MNTSPVNYRVYILLLLIFLLQVTLVDNTGLFIRTSFAASPAIYESKELRVSPLKTPAHPAGDGEASMLLLEHTESSRNMDPWFDIMSLFSFIPQVSAQPSPVGWGRMQSVSSVHLQNEAFLADMDSKWGKDLVISRPSPQGSQDPTIQEVYLRREDGSFPDMPDRSLPAPAGNWFTGLYADMNADGYPDMLRIESKKFGLLNAKAFTRVYVHLYNPATESYPADPSYSVGRKGFFLSTLNGFDIDGDKKADLVLCDFTHNALSTEQMAAAIWEGKITVRVQVYLSGDERKGFPENPSFEFAQKTGLFSVPDIQLIRQGTPCRLFLQAKAGKKSTRYEYVAIQRKFVTTSAIE